jgi:phosphate transport system substrate-binding protein
MKYILGGVAVIGIIAFFIFSFTFKPSGTTPTPSPENQSLTIKGSDTEVQMVSSLAETFSQSHQNDEVSVTGGGSGVGIAALLNQEIDLANSSRPLQEKERALAKEKGLDVQEFIVARDGLSIVVHPENTLETITLEDIAKLYSGQVTNWRELGGKNQPITLYGRQSTSGTFTFFRDTVVKADYAKSMRSMEGSEAIVDAVKADTSGVGYVGVGYIKDEQGQPRADVKILTVSTNKTSLPISPLDKTAVLAGAYPIFRPIYQYLPGVPASDSLVAKFLLFESSAEGQALVEKAGFYSLTAQDVASNEALLQKIQAPQ